VLGSLVAGVTHGACVSEQLWGGLEPSYELRRMGVEILHVLLVYVVPMGFSDPFVLALLKTWALLLHEGCSSPGNIVPFSHKSTPGAALRTCRQHPFSGGGCWGASGLKPGPR